MKVTVRLFASAREVAGLDALELELPPGATIADADAMLRKSLQAPAARLLASAAFAVNHRFARAEHPLADGDELAILPPVSGG